MNIRRVPNTSRWRVSARGYHAYPRSAWRIPLMLLKLLWNPTRYIEGA